MKRLLLALFIVAVAAPVLAQDGPPPEEPPPIVEAAHNRVVAFLQLDEAQEAEWDRLYQEHRDAEQPIQEELRMVQDEIEALFEQGTPDATELGNLAIERHDLGDALREVHEIYHDGVLELLDESQERKLWFLARADDVQKIIPAFKLFELIPRR
jgi:hypothetical protein